MQLLTPYDGDGPVNYAKTWKLKLFVGPNVQGEQHYANCIREILCKMKFAFRDLIK